MDSCHIFSFLFGTRRTTSELRKCFTGSNGSSQAPDGNSKDSVTAAKRSERVGKSQSSRPPVSPLKQFQAKLVNLAVNSTGGGGGGGASSNTVTKIVPAVDQTNRNHLADAAAPRATHQATATYESGTYKAKLVALPLEDEPDNLIRRLGPNDDDDKFKLCNRLEVDENNNNNDDLIENSEQQTKATEIITIDQRKRPPPALKQVILYDNPNATDQGDGEALAERDSARRIINNTTTEQIGADHKQHDKTTQALSERVRHLVQSFESFDSATEATSNGQPANQHSQHEQAAAAHANAPCSPARRNSNLRLRWPPPTTAQMPQTTDELNDQQSAPADDQQQQQRQVNKPTTIVKPLPPKTPPKSNRAKCLNWQLILNKPHTIEQLFQDETFLQGHFFARLQPLDCCSAAQVCRKWRNILYANPNYWRGLVGVIDCTQLRREHLVECIVTTLQTAKLKHLQAANNHCNSIINSNIQSSWASHRLSNNNHDHHHTTTTNGCGGDAISSQASLLDCLDQDEIWRIQELCNRYARGSLTVQRFPSRSLITTTTTQAPIGNNQQQQPQQPQQLQQPQPNQMEAASRSASQQAQNNAAGEPGQGELANSKSQSSIPSQISSTLSSVSISSLLSPLSESSRVDSIREKLYTALDERGFDALCLFGATDDDIEELVSKTRRRPQGAQQRVLVGRLNNCPLTDRGLELFVSHFNQMEELELTGCNEISNSIELKPLTELRRLIITDCINIADGLAQRLIEMFHQLDELVIQAYHLTDAFLEFISLNQDTSRLQRLELPNCKEITNSSMLTIAKHFQHLRELSISGSTKISDDGIEILTEHAKQLRSLDLSWCSRITDVSLECLACDLSSTLVELILDRNLHITDCGLGYLATMAKLELLYIRWCSRITDLGLESVGTLRTLRKLSLAGLHQVTARGLLNLAEAPQLGPNQLEELELTNCAAVNSDLMQFLRTRMPKCNIIL